MIYLATPYSHPSDSVKDVRYHQIEKFTLDRVKNGYYIFSPILMYHHAHMRNLCAGDAETWRAYNEDFMRKADMMWVLKMEGWKTSKGVQSEIRFWENHCNGKPIAYHLHVP